MDLICCCNCFSWFYRLSYLLSENMKASCKCWRWVSDRFSFVLFCFVLLSMRCVKKTFTKTKGVCVVDTRNRWCVLWCLTASSLSQDLVQLVLHRELVQYKVCTSCLMYSTSCSSLSLSLSELHQWWLHHHPADGSVYLFVLFIFHSALLVFTND